MGEEGGTNGVKEQSVPKSKACRRVRGLPASLDQVERPLSGHRRATVLSLPGESIQQIGWHYLGLTLEERTESGHGRRFMCFDAGAGSESESGSGSGCSKINPLAKQVGAS